MNINSLLSRLGLFVATAVVGAFVTSTITAILTPTKLDSAARTVPQVVSTPGPGSSGETVFAAFDLIPASPEPLEAVDAPILQAIAAQQPEPEPNPNGLPRVPAVSQFDGTPFAGANCNMAAGAMLARLGWGIVTTGGTLRALQDDQEGGTDLGDLATALWRGYGVSPRWGGILPDQLRKLIGAGYGAVVHGTYGVLPVPFNKQPSFTGPHAIFIDAYFPGSRKAPAAYFVVDPIYQAGGGYEGEWMPADLVEKFALDFTRNGRIMAAWAYPVGGAAPDVPGIGDLPTSGQGAPLGPADPKPDPADPPLTLTVEPGNLTVTLASPPKPVATPKPGSGGGAGSGGVMIGGVVLIPRLDICVALPKPIYCPGGLIGRYGSSAPPVLGALQPRITIKFVDGAKPNDVLVGFTVDPPGPADVSYWKADGSGGVLKAPKMSSVSLGGGAPTLVAHLPAFAGTEYRFQVVAGGAIGVKSAQGTFTTGAGVKALDVGLTSISSPSYRLDTSVFTLYSRINAGSYAPLIRPCDNGTLLERVFLGGQSYCIPDVTASPPAACIGVKVGYQIVGMGAAKVAIRAVPDDGAKRLDGTSAEDTTIEAVGKSDADEVTLGCLTPGKGYTIQVDLIGDTLGPLMTRSLVAPAS